MIDSSSAVTWFWQIINPPSGSPPVSWSSHTTSQPVITCPVFGDYPVQLQVTDAAANISTTVLDVGCVATDINHIVVDAQPVFSRAVFGDQILFGYNQWPYQDWSNINATQAVASQIGTPSSGSKISADWNVSVGTCYNSGTTWTCSGFNTQTVICGGGTTWPNSPQIWPIVWYNDNVIGGRVGRYPLEPVSSSGACPSPTTFVITTANYAWPPARASACTMGSPCTVAASTNWLYAIDQNSGSYGYYDGATMFEAFHRRTGLNQWATAGQNLTAIEVTAPGIDQGVIPGVQARINPSRQWAVQQVYYPSSANFSVFQLGLRNWATDFGEIFIPPGNTFSAYSQNVNGSKVDVTPYSITDVRENGAAVMAVASAAYVETDPTWQATLNNLLEGAWNNMFSIQTQSDGHWEQSMRGTPSTISTLTQSSTIVTAQTGTYPVGQCGTLETATGTLTANGTNSVVGSGTTFTAGTAGDYVMIYGTFSGVYGKQFLQIVNIADNTHMTFVTPVNLDSASGLSFGIYSQAGSQPTIVFDTSDSSGNNISFLPDSNWYTCTRNSTTQLTLDQPYQTYSRTGFPVNTAGDFYTLNQGTQPFMESFPAAGFQLGALVGTTHAVQMKAAAEGLYPFLSTTGWDALSKGAYYATNFGNCIPQFQFSAGCGSGGQNARMFGVEPVRALAASYLAAPTGPKQTFLNAYYCAEWGNSAYDSLGCDDGSQVHDCGDGFSSASFWKYAYQCFALGSTASMPAALLGGVAPVATRTVQVVFTLSGADHVVISVLAPTGVTTSTTCTSSPCAISVDDRTGAGSSTKTLTYYNSGGAVLAASSPQVIN